MVLKVIRKIQLQLKKYPVILYMKGSPSNPSCGFSEKAYKILSNYVKNIYYVDVLVNEDIRYALPKFSNWPTFPQLWVKKKLIGGCDIILQLHNSCSLKKVFYKI